MRKFHQLAAAAALCAFAAQAWASDGWAALAEPGAIVLFRHANAPGVGDPPAFRLGDCSTQRNLDDAGRAQARAIGEQFRSRKVRVGAVLSSQWCRTLETARLAFGTSVREEPAFNSFFGGPADAPTAQARAVLARWGGPGVLVVVTHQVNITALTGVGPSSAEGTVVRIAGDGTVKVLGSLRP